MLIITLSFIPKAKTTEHNVPKLNEISHSLSLLLECCRRKPIHEWILCQITQVAVVSERQRLRSAHPDQLDVPPYRLTTYGGSLFVLLLLRATVCQLHSKTLLCQYSVPFSESL